MAKKNTFAKRSTMLVLIGVGLGLIIVGVTAFGLQLTGWLMTVASLFAALILVSEVGIKRLTDVVSIKKLGLSQYLALFVALFLFINGILNIPFLSIQVPALTFITLIAFLIAGVMLVAEGSLVMADM